MGSSQCLCLSGSSYSFTNREGQLVQGCKIWFYGDDNLESKNDDNLERGSISRGMMPVESSLPYDLRDKLVIFPGMYEIIEKTKVVDNVRTLVVTDINFVCPVRLEHVQKDKKPN